MKRPVCGYEKLDEGIIYDTFKFMWWLWCSKSELKLKY